MMLRRHSVAALAALLVVASGAGSYPEVPAAAPDSPAEVAESGNVEVTAPVAETSPNPGKIEREVFSGFDPVLTEDITLVARALGDVEVYGAPSDTEPMVTLPGATILGTVTVLAVVGETDDDWVEVMLPMRPNGSTGWVRAEDVDFYVVEGRIVIELGERRLTYYRSGEEVLSSPVAVGTSRNPTPQGVFFVTDSVTLSNPDGPWGPHALGLSGRSDTITEYNGGDGIIGIHGTNKPSSIGEAASLGCIRLPNDVIVELHSMVPIGTPVEIRA